MNGTAWTAEARNMVARLLRKGLTATQIGEHMKVSRNAVIGIVHRDKVLAEIGFMRGGYTRQNRIEAKRAAAKRTVVVKAVQPEPQPKPAPRPVVAFREPHVAPVPLMMLDACRCKWPVNNPPPRQPYLFCGEVKDATRPYCAWHMTRSVGQGTPSEQRAPEALRRAA